VECFLWTLLLVVFAAGTGGFGARYLLPHSCCYRFLHAANLGSGARPDLWPIGPSAYLSDS
jgi:hypothetical protein